MAEHLAWVLDAFRDLATCRPVGFGPSPIPWTAIHDYASANGVRDEDRFVRLIRAMDEALLLHGKE